jgi:hypothetical protein
MGSSSVTGDGLVISSPMAKAASSSGWGINVSDTNTDGVAGRGGAIAFSAKRTDGGNFNAGAIAGAKSNSTGMNENGDLVLYSSVSSSLTERMRIYSAGQITTPSQPRFKARLTATNNNVSNGAIFPFSAVVFDIGNNFNTSTYRFTAPISGYYLFHVQIFRNSASQDNLVINLYKNGSPITTVRTYTGTVADSSIGFATIWNVTAGDYFEIYNTTGVTFPNAYDDGTGRYSYFEGILLG